MSALVSFCLLMSGLMILTLSSDSSHSSPTPPSMCKSSTLSCLFAKHLSMGWLVRPHYVHGVPKYGLHFVANAVPLLSSPTVLKDTPILVGFC